MDSYPRVIFSKPPQSANLFTSHQPRRVSGNLTFLSNLGWNQKMLINEIYTFRIFEFWIIWQKRKGIKTIIWLDILMLFMILMWLKDLLLVVVRIVLLDFGIFKKRGLLLLMDVIWMRLRKLFCGIRCRF